MSPFSPPKKAAFVIGISATLFQPVRSGSHLYTANLYTLRSGHRVKGLTDSRGSFPLGLPCPRLLYPYCITTWVICQGFFEEFLFNLCRLGICCSSSLTPLLYHNLGDLSRGFCHFLDYVVGQATTHQGGLTSS